MYLCWIVSARTSASMQFQEACKGTLKYLTNLPIDDPRLNPGDCPQPRRSQNYRETGPRVLCDVKARPMKHGPRSGSIKYHPHSIVPVRSLSSQAPLPSAEMDRCRLHYVILAPFRQGSKVDIFVGTRYEGRTCWHLLASLATGPHCHGPTCSIPQPKCRGLVHVS